MDVQTIVIVIGVLAISASFHEVAHGYVAYRFGDRTAQRAGRLTLNPIKHVDPFGTILLPLMLLIAGGPVIAAAKPVPINPAYFPNPKKDMIWVALAGPFSNFLLLGIAILILKNIPISSEFVQKIFYIFIQMNFFLGVFNLVPIPPLDGSRVLSGLLPQKYAYKMWQLEPYGMVLVIGAAYLGVFSYVFAFFRPILQFLI
jgi:Zn-dependent protease